MNLYYVSGSQYVVAPRGNRIFTRVRFAHWLIRSDSPPIAPLAILLAARKTSSLYLVYRDCRCLSGRIPLGEASHTHDRYRDQQAQHKVRKASALSISPAA